MIAQKCHVISRYKSQCTWYSCYFRSCRVGATTYRKETVRHLLENIQFAVIRCNLGELATIAGVDWQQKASIVGKALSQWK